MLELTITFPPGTGSGGSNANCSGAPSAPLTGATGWGLIYLNGTCYSDSAIIYVPAGVQTLNAFPFPGYRLCRIRKRGQSADPGLVYLQHDHAHAGFGDFHAGQARNAFSPTRWVFR